MLFLALENVFISLYSLSASLVETFRYRGFGVLRRQLGNGVPGAMRKSVFFSSFLFFLFFIFFGILIMFVNLSREPDRYSILAGMQITILSGKKKKIRFGLASTHQMYIMTCQMYLPNICDKDAVVKIS